MRWCFGYGAVDLGTTAPGAPASARSSSTGLLAQSTVISILVPFRSTAAGTLTTKKQKVKKQKVKKQKVKKQKVKKQAEQVAQGVEQSRSGRKRKRPLKFDEY